VKIRTTKRNNRRSTLPTRLTHGYQQAIERLESLRENQSGADKTWVERAIAEWHDHYARAVRVR